MKILKKLSAEIKKLFGDSSKSQKQKKNAQKKSVPKKIKPTPPKWTHHTILAFQKRLDENFAKGEIEKYFEDGYPLANNDLYYAFQMDVQQLIQFETPNRNHQNPTESLPTIKKYLQANRQDQKDFFMALFYRAIWYALDSRSNYGLYGTANLFAKRKLPFNEQELTFILKAFIHRQTNILYSFQMGHFFKNVESFVKENGIPDTLADTFKQVLDAHPTNPHHKNDYQKLKLRIRELWTAHSSDDEMVLPFLLEKKDAFGKKVNRDIAKLEYEQQRKWYKIFQFAAKAKAGKPSKSFITKSIPLVDELGQKEFIQQMETWLQFLLKMEFTIKSDWHGYFLSDQNTTTTKGLIWILSTLKTEQLTPELEQLILKSFEKIPGVGPASGTLGNAGIYAIYSLGSLTSVASLVRVKAKITQRNTKKLIEKYIANIATKLEVNITDLEDFSIQDFNLTNGSRQFSFKNYSAQLSLIEFGKTKIEWIKPKGEKQKSIPSFVRKEMKEELKELQNIVKLIPKTLTIQRDRLDRSYIQKRTFPFNHFQKYYLHHGLMSFLTQKLIWNFEKDHQKTTAIYWKERWQDVNENPIDWIDKNTTVQLWHPLHSTTEEILQWRDFLQKNQIKQSLKQAYREVYIITEPELKTKTYSNRMAAHILKQHQFKTLANLRNWKYQLSSTFEDGLHVQPCSLEIPDYNLRAEYWINELNTQEAFNHSGIWLYVSTDQVRFLANEKVVNLKDIPAVVFSEIMRDIDLFVGVASVGNDPTWHDKGGRIEYQNYWQSYAFGELSEFAKTRKIILEKLIPKLKIAESCSIDGKFLVVNGKKRTYKIHIGSTNILMTPNDQYLCIVPGPLKDKNNEKLFIPFEGDRGLSILLSKAFMLANDDKITDETILKQIKR